MNPVYDLRTVPYQEMSGILVISIHHVMALAGLRNRYMSVLPKDPSLSMLPIMLIL